MTIIEDLSDLLGQSVQSLFTPQLHFVLSAIAQEDVAGMARAFGFIIRRVYNEKMTISAICDASLGQLLVSILWDNAAMGPDRDAGEAWYAAAREKALYAIDNVVRAVQTKNEDIAMKTGEQQRKRKGAAESLGVASFFTSKRRAVGSNSAIAVTDPGESEPAVVKTLEESFLHVLDILEIVLLQDRHSPKWLEYSALLRGDQEGQDMDYGRLYVSIAILFDLVKGSLHRFASKIFEFLQTTSSLSNCHPGSVRCWLHFVKFVGMPKLLPLIPAIMGELLRLADQLRQRSPETYAQLCQALLTPLADFTCQLHANLVPSLPLLPAWPELKTARQRIASISGVNTASFGEKLEKKHWAIGRCSSACSSERCT
jgi:hypothetical protein